MEDLRQEALAVYEDMTTRETELEAELARVRRVKALAIAALTSLGATQDEVAAVTGLSRQRVGQMTARAHASIQARATESR